MDPSTRALTTEERSDSAPSLSTRAEVIGRFSVREYVSKKLMNEAAYVRLHSELAAARPEFELLVERTGSEGDAWVEYGRLAEGVITAPMMVVVGFAAGYTERMVPGVVAKVASITDTDESNESKDRDW